MNNEEQKKPQIQIENNKLGELDPMAGHPMAGEGRANQEWREDIGKALAVADELTAKTAEVEQVPEASEIDISIFDKTPDRDLDI